MTQPKACPFCGWTGKKSKSICDQLVTMEVGDNWAVICPICGANGPIVDEDDAVVAWNKRPYVSFLLKKIRRFSCRT